MSGENNFNKAAGLATVSRPAPRPAVSAICKRILGTRVNRVGDAGMRLSMKDLKQNYSLLRSICNVSGRPSLTVTVTAGRRSCLPSVSPSPSGRLVTVTPRHSHRTFIVRRIVAAGRKCDYVTALVFNLNYLSLTV